MCEKGSKKIPYETGIFCKSISADWYTLKLPQVFEYAPQEADVMRKGAVFPFYWKFSTLEKRVARP